MPRIIHTSPAPACPECGGLMVLRQPRPGGKTFEAFWGCQSYPNCHGKRNIDEDGFPEDDYENFDDYDLDDSHPGHPNNYGDR